MFKERGTYFLFVRGSLRWDDSLMGGFSRTTIDKTFQFIGAFPAGTQWTQVCKMFESMFGEENVTYRFRLPTGNKFWDSIPGDSEEELEGWERELRDSYLSALPNIPTPITDTIMSMWPDAVVETEDEGQC